MNTEHPDLISVIMGTYDEPIDRLKKSIDSILNQSYKNIELIVCLDNPTNTATYDFLKNLSTANSRIKFIHNTQNIGLGFTLNRCLENAEGNYVARMDADDTCHPQRLEKQLSFLKSMPSNHICFTEVNMIDSTGNTRERAFPHDAEFTKNFFPDDAFVHATLLASKATYCKFKYNISHSPEDYEMYFRMFSEGVRFKLLNEKLYNYYFNSKSEWRPLKERYLRTKKTSRIMLPLLWKNRKALRHCQGYLLALTKYSALTLITLHLSLYTAATKAYTPIRKK